MKEEKELQSPDPNFVSGLRWRLAAEFRERKIRSKEGGSWSLRAILALALALLAGFAVATAAQHYRDSAHASLIIAQEEAALRLAQGRLTLAEAYLEELEREEAQDPSLRETVLLSEYELSRIRREARREALDLEEVRRSGRPPVDTLTAPLIAGRDFVRERLQLDLENLEEKVDLFEEEISRQKRRGEDPIELRYAAMQLEAVYQERDRLRRRLSIRTEFLAGALTAEEVALETERLSLREKLGRARARVEVVESELARLRRAYREGDATLLDLKQAEFQLLEAETEARLTELELAFLLRQTPGSVSTR